MRRMRAGGLHVPHPGNTPIVDHTNFTDNRPTIGGQSSNFNPGANAGPLPNGPMRYPPGESRVQKNVARNLNKGDVPY
jgi:hypothetical protein